MKPAALHPILAIATVTLMHAGLFLAVFAGLHKVGVVFAMAGVFAGGAWALARYQSWDSRE